MLELINIKKDYETGDTKVAALKGINLRFRDCEFVSILGQSGCGKTTMLNIIGGLDKYTSGDLRINGVSTKDYKDRDWDAYRNNSIGFVFQSYNLIPHQTVLSNVELALTLSGVSKAERRKRAVEALEKVGLGEQIHKKPNQMSGGQMQRVAIARVPGMAAKGPGEIQPDQRRGFLLIPGKLQPPVGDAPPVQLPAQQGGLGSLAGAICPFKHDKPALHMCALPYAAQKFILL